MPTVSLSDGRTVEFPDGMSQDAMAAALRKLPPMPKTGGVNNFAAGINEGIATTLGAPVDLVTGALNLGSRGINAMAGTNIKPIENPVGGSGTFKSLMGMVGADPRNIAPQDRADELLRAGGQGVGSAVMPGMVAGALPQAAGPVLGTIQRAVASGATPGAAAVSGVAGAAGSAAEEAVPAPYKPIANVAAQTATGVGAGLAQRGGRGLMDAFMGVPNITPERAGMARRLIDEYQIPLTAPDIQPGSAPMRWAQAGLDYLPFSGAAKRQNNLQEAVNRALLKETGGDATGAAGPRFGYDAAAGAEARIGKQYDQALTGVEFPSLLNRRFEELRAKISESTLAPREQRGLGMAMQNIERVARENGGNLTGKEYQGLRISGSSLNNLMADANPIVKNFARDIKNALDANFQLGAPPENAALYGLSNQQYRTLMALKPEITKGEPGNIPLTNLQNAANRAYPRRAFDTEQNAIGDLGDASKMFLRRLPESGTAPRAGVQAGLAALAKGDLGSGAGALAGLGATAGAGVGMGIPGIMAAVGGGNLANRVLNSEAARDALLRRILNPSPTPPAIPPWLLGSIPAQAATREGQQ
jgi:hypothetical protein